MNFDSEKEQRFNDGMTDKKTEDGFIEFPEPVESMEFKSLKEKMFYKGIMSTRYQSSETVVVQKTLHFYLERYSDKNFWYAFGEYVRYLAAGGEPFLDQVSRGDKVDEV